MLLKNKYGNFKTAVCLHTERNVGIWVDKLPAYSELHLLKPNTMKGGSKMYYITLLITDRVD